MEQTLAHLIRMRTLSADTKANNEGLDYLEEYFSSRGLFCERYEFNNHGALVATTKAKSKHVKIMLCAHIDVMPGSDTVFTMRTEGGKLFGRGTFDMKFAIAAYMHAIDELGPDLSTFNIGVMITTDEEFGGANGINGVRDLIEIAGYSADAAVLPDGGDNWQLERLAKGHWRFMLNAHGQTAHGSRPWEGDSATFKLIDGLCELKAAFKDQSPETETLNIGILDGGLAFNQIPAAASAAVEIRLTSPEGYDHCRALVDGICKRHGLEAVTAVLEMPAIADMESPYAEAFIQSIRTVTGEPSGTCVSFAASDTYHFAAHDIPYIAVRPPGGKHHSEDEWIDRAALHQFKDVIKDYLIKYEQPNRRSLVAKKKSTH